VCEKTYKLLTKHLQGFQKKVPPLLEFLVGIAVKKSIKGGYFFPDTLYNR